MADVANSAGPLHLTVVTPERAVLDVRADFVVVPLFDGELGVHRGHAAFVGQLGPGEFRYTTGGVTHRYFIDGGFVQVRTDTVSVLTAKAVPAADVTPAVVEQQRAAAAALPVAGPSARAGREKAVARATAMGRVAAKN